MLVLTRKLRPDRRFARTHLGDGTLIELTSCAGGKVTLVVTRKDHEPHTVRLKVGERRLLYGAVVLVVVSTERPQEDPDGVHGGQARIGFEAPRELSIVREEVL